MNALVKKEIRLLLPSWVLALLLAVSASVVADHTRSTSYFRVYFLFIFPFLLGPAMVVMMALASFGHELSAGTFSNLLAQPLARARIWWTKALLLAAALASAWGLWWVCIINNPDLAMAPAERGEMRQITLVLVAVAYSGGLWAVLLLRQVVAAFWFTILLPAALAGGTVYFTKEFGGQDYFETHLLRNITCVLVAYSALGVFWARRLFLRAQDVQWTGGEIGLPRWLKRPRLATATARTQGRRPRLALLAKEFHLHQSQLVIAGVLAIAHLGFILARNVSGGFKDSPGLEFVAYQLWVLWPVMALLIGCAAVAEERKLGTLEAQLCLPTRRRTQFLAKSGFAFALALGLGVGMPLLLEGGRILPNLRIDPSQFGASLAKDIIPGSLGHAGLEVLSAFNPVLPFVPLILVTIILVALSFYASTLARNTLQAIAPGVIGVVLVWAILFGAPHLPDLTGYPLWRGWLIHVFGLPVLVIALGWLAYSNFKRVFVGSQVWRHNLGVLGGALAAVMVVTSAVYHRAWELVTPFEPAHGPARLTRAGVTVQQDLGGQVTLRLADGRVWATRFVPAAVDGLEAMLGERRMTTWFGAGRFLEGTNWSAVAVCGTEILGLKEDGTLWISEAPAKARQLPPAEADPRSDRYRLAQFETDRDWKSLIGTGYRAFLLKQDGSLWFAGTNRPNSRKPWPGLRAFPPRRLGSDADWSELSFDTHRVVLRKSDGRAYVLPPYQDSDPPDSLKLTATMIAGRAPQFDGKRWLGTAWAWSGKPARYFQTGVRSDGTLRVRGRWELPAGRTIGQHVWRDYDVQLGSGTNWIGLADGAFGLVTLKADGTLWRWDFPADPFTRPDLARATRLGRNQDWIAIFGGSTAAVALAADGSFWCWPTDLGEISPRAGDFQPLLAPSRRPQLVASLFGNPE